MLETLRAKFSHTKSEIKKEIKRDMFALSIAALTISVYVVGKWDDYKERKDECQPIDNESI